MPMIGTMTRTTHDIASATASRVSPVNIDARADVHSNAASSTATHRGARNRALEDDVDECTMWGLHAMRSEPAVDRRAGILNGHCRRVFALLDSASRCCTVETSC